MTGREHEAQEVVADVVLRRGLEVCQRRLPPGLQLATQLLVLALEPLAPAQPVDGAMLRGGHEPGARVVRDPRLRPPLERDDESVLGGPTRSSRPRRSRDGYR